MSQKIKEIEEECFFYEDDNPNLPRLSPPEFWKSNGVLSLSKFTFGTSSTKVVLPPDSVNEENYRVSSDRNIIDNKDGKNNLSFRRSVRIKKGYPFKFAGGKSERERFERIQRRNRNRSNQDVNRNFKKTDVLETCEMYRSRRVRRVNRDKSKIIHQSKLKKRKKKKKSPKTPQKNRKISIEEILEKIDEVESLTGLKRRLMKKLSERKYKISEEANSIMKEWLVKNISNPYPSPKEKEELAEDTGLRKSQVCNWFKTTRITYWREFFIKELNL